MGLPGCLFVCHLILLLVCFLFNCSSLEASGLAPATGILLIWSTRVPVLHSTGYVQLFLSSGALSLVLKPRQKLVNDPCSNLQDP